MKGPPGIVFLVVSMYSLVRDGSQRLVIEIDPRAGTRQVVHPYKSKMERWRETTDD